MAHKKVLIISPYFPPDNAADMHRIRTSLPYFADYGWNPEVVAVHPGYTDIVKDRMLVQSLPTQLSVHYVRALNKKTTSKFGLGSLALRSLWFYFRYVNRLLKTNQFDLIYFSTTQFPVLILGAYWKRKFNIKIVFDIQDPWHTRYYKNKPKAEQPKKYWFSYHLNRILEPIAMKAADGLISVSENYVKTLKDRYPEMQTLPHMVIPFGMHLPDLEIALKNLKAESSILPLNGKKHIVYVGRGGHDLKPALTLLFHALKCGLNENPNRFNSVQLHLIGTSYAASGIGEPTFSALINEFELQHLAYEITDRIPFYRTINTLIAADLLFIPGPDQPAYTASKLFPYLMAQKPILAIMHTQSSALQILKSCNHACILNHGQEQEIISTAVSHQVNKLFEAQRTVPSTDFSAYLNNSAEHFTELQTQVFNTVCNVDL